MEEYLQSLGFNSSQLHGLLNNLTLGDLKKLLASVNISEVSDLDTTQHLHEPVVIAMMILCLLALLTNILSILATKHVPSNLFTAHFRLILSLAAGDILTVFSVVFHIMNKVLNPPVLFHLNTKEERLMSACGFQFVVSLNVTAHLISLLNLFAMAQDHYVAIMKPLHYNQIMTSRRVNQMISILWAFALLGGFSNFLAGIAKPSQYEDFNLCERALYSDYQAEYLLIIMTVLCFLGIAAIYIILYSTIKKLQKFPISLAQNKMPNKKALVTTLLIIGTFGLCWLPDMLFELVMIIQIHVDDSKVKEFIVIFVQANKYLYILLLCNSLFDPIIYAIRLKEVQMGYIRFLSKNFRCCRKIFKKRRLSWSISTCGTENTQRVSMEANSEQGFFSLSPLGKKSNCDRGNGDSEKLMDLNPWGCDSALH